MKRTVLLSLIAAALLLTACGTAAGQAAAPTAAPAAGGGSQADASGATEVDVTLADNTIQSSLTTFKVGVPYKFVIINNGNHLHNFNINTPVDKAGSLDAALSGALLSVTQDKLPIGGGTTVMYTFPASAAGQPLELSCLIRRHYEDGMRLPITVTH
jgi:uncharacterized cupredoxin-like copper-binding protein